MFLSLSGSHSSGSWESVCSGGFPDVCELWTAVSYVCPLLDVSNGAFLLEHSLAADGRPGARPDHPAADHTSAYRSVPRYLALLSQVTCTCFNLLHFVFLYRFFLFSHLGAFYPSTYWWDQGWRQSTRPILLAGSGGLGFAIGRAACGLPGREVCGSWHPAGVKKDCRNVVEGPGGCTRAII